MRGFGVALVLRAPPAPVPGSWTSASPSKADIAARYFARRVQRVAGHALTASDRRRVARHQRRRSASRRTRSPDSSSVFDGPTALSIAKTGAAASTTRIIEQLMRRGLRPRPTLPRGVSASSDGDGLGDYRYLAVPVPRGRAPRSAPSWWRAALGSRAVRTRELAPVDAGHRPDPPPRGPGPRLLAGRDQLRPLEEMIDELEEITDGRSLHRRLAVPTVGRRAGPARRARSTGCWPGSSRASPACTGSPPTPATSSRRRSWWCGSAWSGR